jgi:hypothetical protein
MFQRTQRDTRAMSGRGGIRVACRLGREVLSFGELGEEDMIDDVQVELWNSNASER